MCHLGDIEDTPYEKELLKERKIKNKKPYPFKFVLIEAKYLNNERYWALFIEDIKDLFNYFEQINPSIVQTYARMKQDKLKKHPNTVEENIIYNLFAVNNNDRKTLLDDLEHINKAQEPKLRMILNGKKLLINQSGFGFCPYNSKHHKVIKTIKRKDYNFPTHTLTKKDIKISKWAGGKHWYVKIGNHQLDEKFNTIEYAEEQADKFLRKLSTRRIKI